MLKIGTVIDGKYKILNEIGHGGMSNVYLAINEKANKPWAVKEVRKSVNRDFELLKQSLIMETDLLKKLKHPNLPSIIDVIDSDENFLIVMDYIEGNTLERLLAEEGAQPQEKVADWALQLCDVLDYLHTRPVPVIYRDMKPSNIMLKSDGSVVLIDFGTAREFKDKNVSDTIWLGTKGYAAPEQFGGMGQTDARTDIFCLGTTLYHLLTGHNPSEPPYELYPITRWNERLSTGLEQIIAKCTRKNPDDRYQTVRELRYDLVHYHDLEIQAQRRYRSRLRLFGAAAALSLLCAFGGMGFSVAAGKKQGDEYQDYMHMAEISPDSVAACRLYMDAVAVDETRGEAYHAFYKKAVEDGVFSDAEEELILKLGISTHKYLQSFQKKNAKEYADFCYEMGNAYWYYYEHEENRQSRAVSWFQAAMDYYGNDAARAAEHKRCRLYVELGTFYKSVIASQIDGTDATIYGEYWRSLTELKALNDAEPDREIITLRIYREIASRVVEYVGYFKEDGVTGEEIVSMLNEIEDDLCEMEQRATSAVQEEIGTIRWIIDGAHKMVRAAYKIKQ
ncbi:MAG: serine/threonine protein kinase [Lachnospiraceae bacterium]|nr:serine/threonine protein kinase [Lachnospiraceae bacterium]